MKLIIEEIDKKTCRKALLAEAIWAWVFWWLSFFGLFGWSQILSCRRAQIICMILYEDPLLMGFEFGQIQWTFFHLLGFALILCRLVVLCLFCGKARVIATPLKREEKEPKSSFVELSLMVHVSWGLSLGRYWGILWANAYKLGLFYCASPLRRPIETFFLYLLWALFIQLLAC